jgi:hypothetical protein
MRRLYGSINVSPVAFRDLRPGLAGEGILVSHHSPEADWHDSPLIYISNRCMTFVSC